MVALIQPLFSHPFNLPFLLSFFLNCFLKMIALQLHLMFTLPEEQSSFQKECYGTMTLRNLSWNHLMPALMISMPPGGEKCKTASTLILTFSPIFHPKTVRPLPTSQEGGHSLESISLLWSPLPGKAIKLLLSSPPTLSPYLYSAMVNRDLFFGNTTTSKRTFSRHYDFNYMNQYLYDFISICSKSIHFFMKCRVQ